MNLKKVSSVLILFAAITSSSAAPNGASYDYVSKVNSEPNSNYLMINVKGNFQNPHVCSNPWYAVSTLPLSDERTKEMLSIALASLLGRKGVYVVTDGCSASGRLLLTGIQIQQD